MYAKGNGKGATFVAILAVVLGTTGGLGCGGSSEIGPDNMAFGANVQSTSGGWSTSGTLRTERDEGIVNLQANFPTADYYTVELGVRPPTFPSGGSVFYNAEVTVAWKVEGNFIQRKVNLGAGVSISGTGQAVEVSVVDKTPSAFVGGLAGAEYGVTILVSKGTRPSQNKPAIYQRASDGQIHINAGATAGPITIPTDAGPISVEIIGLDGNNVEAKLAVFMETASGGTTLKSYAPTVDTGFVPLIPNATVLFVTNTGAQGCNIAITWGIDG